MPYDVAVVGAGVFGAWTAFHLARSGKQVLIVDRHAPANTRASSGGESRIIRMSYGAGEIYTRSAIRSLSLWKQFFPSMFIPTGVLVVGQASGPARRLPGRRRFTPDPYLEASREALIAANYPHEWLDTKTLRARFPEIAFDPGAHAILEPASGVLMARRAVQAVVEAAVAAGARYETRVMEKPDAKLARTFVFACGPWLGKLFPDVIGRRIRPTRQEVFFFGPPPGGFPLPCWIAFREGAYSLPPLDGHGFKLAIDEHGPRFDPETGNRNVTSSSIARARKILARRFPALADAPLLETRVCQYENTSSGDFLIDRHPHHDRVWLVGGGSGHGFKHGPYVGEYVASQIARNTPPEPRFSLASKTITHHRSVY